MGKGTVAKKRGGGKGGGDNAELDMFKDKLESSGTFILRDFCRNLGMDYDESKKKKKSDLTSFLVKAFKDGKVTFNDLYGDDDGGDDDEPITKSPKKRQDDEDSGSDDGDDDDLGDDDGAGDDDLDDDDLDLELEDDSSDEEGGEDDLDLEDEAGSELDDDDGSDDEGGSSDDGPDISIIEDKLDKIIDLLSKVSKTMDLLVQLSLEGFETVRQIGRVQFKISKVKNVGRLIKQIEGRARKFAGIEDNGESDDDLEDE